MCGMDISGRKLTEGLILLVILQGTFQDVPQSSERPTKLMRCRATWRHLRYFGNG